MNSRARSDQPSRMESVPGSRHLRLGDGGGSLGGSDEKKRPVCLCATILESVIVHLHRNMMTIGTSLWSFRLRF